MRREQDLETRAEELSFQDKFILELRAFLEDDLSDAHAHAHAMIKVFMRYNSDQLISDVLDTLSNRELKRLKNRIIDIISEKRDEDQVTAYFYCLLPTTLLGQILYKPRYRTVSYSSGSLEKIIQNLARLAVSNTYRFNMGFNQVSVENIDNRFLQYPLLIESLVNKIPLLKNKFGSTQKQVQSPLVMRGLFVSPPEDEYLYSVTDYFNGQHEVYGDMAVRSTLPQVGGLRFN